MSSHWTPSQLSNVGKTPYVWLDCSSSNVSNNTSNFVSYLKDKFESGNDLNSLHSYNQIFRALPTQHSSNKINNLSTVTFIQDLQTSAIGLTQVNTFNLSTSGTCGKMVLLMRQGLYPGTLFGVNRSNTVSPWQYVRTSAGSGGASVGNFANIASTSTLFKSSGVTTSALSNITVPTANNVFMLSMSNLNSNHNFNGLCFNYELYLADGGGGPCNLNGFAGDFGELVVWRESTSANNVIQELVEGYVAWKWGIQSYLNIGHTYKNAAPTFSTLNPAPFGTYNGNVTKLLWLDASDSNVCSTNFVVKIEDKSGNGNSLNTIPSIKQFPVWPIYGEKLNGLSTTRFTQYAGLTQPTSIENLSAIFVVGRQLASPSNGTWIQTLFGHDQYNDFAQSGVTSNQFYYNSLFPAKTLYCISGGVVVSNLAFPPANSPFILVQKIVQVPGANVTARFQGLCYNCSNDDSGWIGDIGEVIMFRKKTVTDKQTDLMIMYLANKWGLSLQDTNAVLPNVKPFSTFTPISFLPIAWYDSSDSQINTTLSRVSGIFNNTSNIQYQSNSTVLSSTPFFSIGNVGVVGKFGNTSGLGGSPANERPMNGLPTMYIDNNSTLTFYDYSKFGYSDKPLTNIFFVGRQGQYANSIQPWNVWASYATQSGTTGNYYVTYNGKIWVSSAHGVGNRGRVPGTYYDDAQGYYWTEVSPSTVIQKYQTIFGNLGYGIEATVGDFSNNPLLGGKVIPSQLVAIDSGTSVSTVASNASTSKNNVNSYVFAESNAYNSNLLKAKATCYSRNQFKTSRYQITTPASRFVKAQTVNASNVSFPSPASEFLLSINGIQEAGFQDTTFRGLFYDNNSFQNGWQGDFAEIITFTDNLTPQEILLVEGYLATKWGLQDSLPPTHPFLYSNSTSECLTGYSPLEFSTIGGDVTSSNDQIAISGIPSIINVAKGYYTSDTIVTTLNINLPIGLTVEIQSGTSNQITWINTAEDIDYQISCTPTSANVFGFEPAPTYFTVPASSSATAPNNFYLLPLTVDAQIITIFGGTGVGTNVTLIDGKYNGVQLAAMIQKAILDKVGSTILTVQFGSRSTNLTFTNITPKNIVSSAGYFASKMLGLISPSATQPVPPAEDSTFFTIPANSFFEFPYSLAQITALSICKWDGQVACPTNYAQVDSDSNELALPFAKRCAKPFSLLLPQVLTNAGLSNQSFSCPIGTELIGKNQNADPEHPVCSYVCEPPYYDSGTTCGYFPVYSPGDQSSINILNDNSSANITQVNLADTSKGSTSSALRFMILAVIVSFLVGLAIKAFPTLTANPPTESAAGSVLESVIQSQSQSSLKK